MNTCWAGQSGHKKKYVYLSNALVLSEVFKRSFRCNQNHLTSISQPATAPPSKLYVLPNTKQFIEATQQACMYQDESATIILFIVSTTKY